jgi:hypothetical protein
VIGNGVTSIGNYAFSSCDKLADITYTGTTAQWNAVSKSTSWYSGIPAKYVQCSDGQVAI